MEFKSVAVYGLTVVASNQNGYNSSIFFFALVAPVSLEILEKPTYVSEGREREVTCQAVGGFPSPTIEWWIGTKNLQPTYQVYPTLRCPPVCLHRWRGRSLARQWGDSPPHHRVVDRHQESTANIPGISDSP
jgi:hypothetical protein